MIKLLTECSWLIQIAIVLIATFIAYLVEKSFYHRVYPKLVATNNIWDDILLSAIHRPLIVLIWVLGLSFAVDIIHQTIPQAVIFKAITPLRQTIIISLIVWAALRYIRLFEHNYVHAKNQQQQTFDRTSIRAVSQLTSAAVIIVALLIILDTLGFSLNGVLAFGGVSGIAIGFAAKDILANFFGGLMIYLDRPFAVGDWIRSPDRNIEGTVEYIGWRLCRIRTFDQRPLYVPNAVFSTIAVENPSRMSNRRIYATIGVRYDDAAKIPLLLQAIREMLQAHPAIDTTKTMLVNVTELAASSINFMVYTFTKTTDWAEFQAMQQDVLLKVLALIDQHGAVCPFPTSTINLPESIMIKTSKLEAVTRQVPMLDLK